jgi:hypothetical protein
LKCWSAPVLRELQSYFRTPPIVSETVCPPIVSGQGTESMFSVISGFSKVFTTAQHSQDHPSHLQHRDALLLLMSWGASCREHELAGVIIECLLHLTSVTYSCNRERYPLV